MRGEGAQLTKGKPSLAPPILPRHRRLVGDEGLLGGEEDPFAVVSAAVRNLDRGRICSRGKLGDGPCCVFEIFID